MQAFFFFFYIVEAFAIAYTGWRICKEKQDRYISILLMVLFAFVQCVSSSFSLINLEDVEETALIFRICEFMPAITCICTTIILLLAVYYFFKSLNFFNLSAYLAFFVFCTLGIMDVGLIATNLLHHQVFIPQLFYMWDSPTASYNFFITNSYLYFYHEIFSVALEIMIFFALLLKCSLIPVAYIGKYIFIGVYLIVSALINYFFNQFTDDSLKVQYPVLFFSMFPVVVYFITYHYKPSIMLSYIRHMVFEKLGSPVLLFDINDLLTDYNKDASDVFVLDRRSIDHLQLSDFLKRITGNQFRPKKTSTVEEIKLKTPSGAERIYKMDYSKLSDKYANNLGTLLIFHDVTELKDLYNTMEKTAMTDVLTGLASGTFLNRKITEINLYRKFPYSAVVCELNGLSLIQEGFGEDAAKAATMHVADVLRKQLRATDFASYSEGNMVILMPDTDVVLAEKVFKRVAAILEKDTTFNFMLSFEYGIASKPTKDSDMHLTVSQASALLAKNKMVNSIYVQDSIIESLQKTLRNSSFETEVHSKRVVDIATEIANKLNLSKGQIDELKLLAMFHDIGKLSVPQEILLKPTSLTEEEKQVMVLHTINGFKIANCSAELSPIARGILCHHENWDGSGYPNGYKGEEIPFLSRIISVADSFDVMTHDRVYAKACSVEEAKMQILKLSGTKFDPAIVKAFETISDEELKKFL